MKCDQRGISAPQTAAPGSPSLGRRGGSRPRSVLALEARKEDPGSVEERKPRRGPWGPRRSPTPPPSLRALATFPLTSPHPGATHLTRALTLRLSVRLPVCLSPHKPDNPAQGAGEGQTGYYPGSRSSAGWGLGANPSHSSAGTSASTSTTVGSRTNPGCVTPRVRRA